jgi:hypothetical protein
MPLRKSATGPTLTFTLAAPWCPATHPTLLALAAAFAREDASEVTATLRGMTEQGLNIQALEADGDPLLTRLWAVKVGARRKMFQAGLAGGLDPLLPIAPVPNRKLKTLRSFLAQAWSSVGTVADNAWLGKIILEQVPVEGLLAPRPMVDGQGDPWPWNKPGSAFHQALELRHANGLKALIERVGVERLLADLDDRTTGLTLPDQVLRTLFERSMRDAGPPQVMLATLPLFSDAQLLADRSQSQPPPRAYEDQEMWRELGIDLDHRPGYGSVVHYALYWSATQWTDFRKKGNAKPATAQLVEALQARLGDRFFDAEGPVSLEHVLTQTPNIDQVPWAPALLARLQARSIRQTAPVAPASRRRPGMSRG